MNTERDELAGLLFTTDNRAAVNPWSEWEHSKQYPDMVEYVYAMADAILAAGYRKPSQVITPEEVSELPDGSLIMSGDRIRMYDGTVWRIRGGMVEMVGREARGVTPFRYFVDPLPATVLYEPEHQP